jgi:hypothetical protein
VLGLSQVKFRRYGIAGQEQHGIDLAGRHPDRTYTVIQCKEYQRFTEADLRAAVEKFAVGKRPFEATRLVVAVSTVTRTTQIEVELAALQNEREDLEIELWGAEQINDALRERADIVSRFWTRETAHTFCTGAPLPGVAAPPPNWVRVAEQILLTPLGVDGLDHQLVAADELRDSDPAAAAAEYQRLADSVISDGFTGHAQVLRHKQLEALTEAGMHDEAAALGAELAAIALHEADYRQAQSLRHRLESLSGAPKAIDTSTARHAQLIAAAVDAATHPLGDVDGLLTVLRNPPPDIAEPTYRPLLVLMLAELRMADNVFNPPDVQEMAESATATSNDVTAAHLWALGDLIEAAIAQLVQARSAILDKELRFRLQLAKAAYDLDERASLVSRARQLRLPLHQAALVLAAEARREALDGAVDEAVGSWRLAINHALHEGRTDDAGGWLYAIRAARVLYGPWKGDLDEEHLLAQSLPKSGGPRLIRRARDPAPDVRRELLDGRGNLAIVAARRWLADCIATGDWANETEAAELLGDLFAGNAEPDRAAACYQWAGKEDKLVKLADALGDHLLPSWPFTPGPWWRQSTNLRMVEAQHDLIDDATAGTLLSVLLDVVSRGRAGELIEDPTHRLTLNATRAVCALAGRGSSSDAVALLGLFAADVPRAQGIHNRYDEQHVRACRSIAAHHP